MNSGYRSYMNQPKRPKPKRSQGSGEYFFPFLFIVAGSIILILIYQVGATWVDQRSTDVADKMLVKVESGTARILPWGETNWIGLYDGSSVLEGDSVELGANSVMALTLADGSAFRFGDGASFTIDNKDKTGIEIDMEGGRVWYFPADKAALTSIKIDGKMSSALATDDSEFAYASLNEDALRVVGGEASITALNKDVSLSTFKVGVGQQVILTPNDIEELKTGKTLSLLRGISDSYRERDWYVLNTTKDPRMSLSTPEPSAPSDSDNSDSDGDTASDGGEGNSTDASPTPEPVDLNKADAPVITSPENGLNTAESQVTLEGTVGKDVAKVRVDHLYGERTAYSHVLGRYKKGSGKWKYTAVGGDDSNMRSGKNVYHVVSLDDAGKESKVAKVTINYYPDGVPEDAPAPTPEPTSDSASASSTVEAGDSNDTAEASPTPTPQVTYKLSSPSVASYNGSGEPTTTETNVKVMGTVDPSSVRVFVNGFALTGYRGGERDWTYYAAEKYGTLKDGNNTYRVYSVDAEGNKSAITEFTITKKSE